MYFERYAALQRACGEMLTPAGKSTPAKLTFATSCFRVKLTRQGAIRLTKRPRTCAQLQRIAEFRALLSRV